MKILRTSMETKMINDKKEKMATCPECGNKRNFGTICYETRGFFKTTIYENRTFSCVCGCKWETGYLKADDFKV